MCSAYVYQFECAYLSRDAGKRRYDEFGLVVESTSGWLRRTNSSDAVTSAYSVTPMGALWERRTAPDERNRIRLAMRCLLVEHDDGLVLVDTGIGDKDDAKFRDMVVKRGNTIIQLADDEQQRWIKATEPVYGAWIEQMKAKGIDGGKLVEAAREAVAKHNKA